MNAVVIPLGVEPAEPSRDPWQPRLLRILAGSERITTGDLRGIAPETGMLRDYLRWLEGEGFIVRGDRNCAHPCRKCHSLITVTDRAALQRLLRESDPRHYSAVARTAVIAHAGPTGTTSTATVT
jgi:hypothetical protein